VLVKCAKLTKIEVFCRLLMPLIFNLCPCRRNAISTASVGVRSLASIPSLPSSVAEFVSGAVAECKPAKVHVVTGTPDETADILANLEKEGMVKKLSKYENW